MSTIPAPFSTVCTIAHYSDEDTVTLWTAIAEKIIKEFITWLFYEEELAETQCTSLEQVFSQVIQEEAPSTDNILTLVEPILSKDQCERSAKRYAELVVNTTQRFYNKCIEHMTTEEKAQVQQYLGEQHAI